jgi:hypothetical protein
MALHGEPRPTGSAGDGTGDGGVRPGHDDATAGRQFHHDPALLAQAAARAVYVPQIHADEVDVAGETAQRQPEPLLEVRPQLLSDLHTTPSNLQAHAFLLS